jgi:hypothetical protein
MDPMEATKRVARALVRVIFRMLSSLVEKADGEQPSEQNHKAGESDMANGSLRSDQSHESNISLSSLRGSKAKKTAISEFPNIFLTILETKQPFT